MKNGEQQNRIDELENAITANDKHLQEVEALNTFLLAALKRLYKEVDALGSKHAKLELARIQAKLAISVAEAARQP